jgi:hypothetical protein
VSGRPADELCSGYEALRAAATGWASSETPRGLALLVAQGLPAWIRAWNPLAPSAPSDPAGERPVVSGAGRDVVRVLTEMALGARHLVSVP